MNPLLDIIIINYNTRVLADKCIERLLSLNLEHNIHFIDNNSTDNSFKYINEKYGERINSIFNTENNGYSKAANQGISITNGKYILILNTDVLATKEYIDAILKSLEENSNIAAATGKLIKFDVKDMSILNVLDSTGIVVYKNLNMLDRGQNEKKFR